MSNVARSNRALAVLTTALAQFHREVFLPDFERIVCEAIVGRESRMQANFDAILQRLDKILEKRFDQ